jgi:hypothetical protein
MTSDGIYFYLLAVFLVGVLISYSHANDNSHRQPLIIASLLFKVLITNVPTGPLVTAAVSGWALNIYLRI